MKQGRTLQDLAAEITRQSEVKKDYVVGTQNLEAVYDTGINKSEIGLRFANSEVADVDVNDLAHKQIGEHTEIPARYYEKMRKEEPGLLAENINTWFRRYPIDRMVRTLDNRARAFLSDRYRPLENFDLAEATLPILSDLKCKIVSCDITETRLYIKAVDERVVQELPAGARFGDGKHTIVRTRTLHPAITITNSEVGMGALSVDVGAYDGFCTNLAFFGGRGMKKYHIGGKHELGEQLVAMLSDRTRKLQDASLWSTVRDVVKGAFEAAKFAALVDELRETQTQTIKGDPVKVVELTAKKFGLNEGERGSVMRHLIEGGDLSRFGLFSAITRMAEDVPDYDRASDHERLGGRLIELPKNEWLELAEAA